MSTSTGPFEAQYRGVAPLALPPSISAPAATRALTLSSPELAEARSDREVAVAGMAVARQRPATAKGIVFMLLEDEFGQVNLIVPPQVYDRHRALVRGEPLILARGRFERIGRNQNVLVDRLETLGPLARRISGDHGIRDALPDAYHFGHR